MRALHIAGYFLLVVAFVAGTFSYSEYRRFDLESLTLDDAARRGVPGSFVHLADGVVHYELAGPADAPTVVLVHGFSVPYYLWDQNFDALAKAGFRVLRYDLYGRGWSDRPTVHYDPDLFDRQLAQLLDALAIRGPVHLVGASMGGPISAEFANRHPERIRTVSLLDPVYGRGFTPPLALRIPVYNDLFFCVRLTPQMALNQREDFVHPERYADYFAKYETQMHYKGFRRAMLSTVRDFLSRDFTGEYSRLGRSSKPVLLVWGVVDTDVPFALNKDVRAAVPQAEFHAIGDAGHVPFYEHPEIVNPALIEFLRRH
jgi:pimeloyl-ACP methyl ester carboxylesterase